MMIWAPAPGLSFIAKTHVVESELTPTRYPLTYTHIFSLCNNIFKDVKRIHSFIMNYWKQKYTAKGQVYKPQVTHPPKPF